MSYKWVITDIFTSYKGRKGFQPDHGILPLEKWITGFKFGKNFKEGPMISVWLVPGDHNHTHELTGEGAKLGKELWNGDENCRKMSIFDLNLPFLKHKLDI